MAFPYHDQVWVEVADYVSANRQEGEAILAPDLFWWRFEAIHTYEGTFLNPELHYDWAVIHKGQLYAISSWTLARLQLTLRPVFANEVFVVLTTNASLAATDETDPHLQSFEQQLSTRRQNPRPDTEDAEDDGASVASSSVVPEPGVITKFESLTDAELREAMDKFFAGGGYEYLTARDRALRSEVRRRTSQLLPDTAGLKILDVGCGGGFVTELVHDPQVLVGIDISKVAVAECTDSAGESARSAYAVVDGQQLAFPDECFDLVTCIETLEHILDATGAIAELARVLQPGGTLVANFANRDSLHLLLNRKLGFPEYKTNHQHIREFTIDEIDTLLEDVGLRADQMLGTMLYPYFEIPGVDEAVRVVVDEDPQLVEALRLLGDRGGPDFSYSVAFSARKETGGSPLPGSAGLSGS